MDGIHDLGGKQGWGPVGYTVDAKAFHAEWEVRANALYAHAVRSGLFNMDEYRHAIERMDARHYISASYYERSLTSLATLCVEKGVFTRAQLEQRAAGSVPLAAANAQGRGNVEPRHAFAVGDRVRVRDEHAPGHVRMPGYVRGKVGVVVGVSPSYPFPDAHAHGVEAQDEPTFDVRFNSRELWGPTADPAFVHAGLFRSYLIPA